MPYCHYLIQFTDKWRHLLTVNSPNARRKRGGHLPFDTVVFSHSALHSFDFSTTKIICWFFSPTPLPGRQHVIKKENDSHLPFHLQNEVVHSQKHGGNFQKAAGAYLTLRLGRTNRFNHLCRIIYYITLGRGGGVCMCAPSKLSLLSPVWFRRVTDPHNAPSVSPIPHLTCITAICLLKWLLTCPGR